MLLSLAFLIQAVAATPAQAACDRAAADRYTSGFNQAVKGERVLEYIAKNTRVFKECYTAVDARKNPVFDFSKLSTVGGPIVDREAEQIELSCTASRGGENCRKDSIDTPLAFLKSMSLLHSPSKFTGKERNPQYLMAGFEGPRLLVCCSFDGHKQAFPPRSHQGCLSMSLRAMNWCREIGPGRRVVLVPSDRGLVSQARELCKDPEIRKTRELCSEAGDPVLKVAPAVAGAASSSSAPD